MVSSEAQFRALKVDTNFPIIIFFENTIYTHLLLYPIFFLFINSAKFEQ